MYKKDDKNVGGFFSGNESKRKKHVSHSVSRDGLDGSLNRNKITKHLSVSVNSTKGFSPTFKELYGYWRVPADWILLEAVDKTLNYSEHPCYCMFLANFFDFLQDDSSDKFKSIYQQFISQVAPYELNLSEGVKKGMKSIYALLEDGSLWTSEGLHQKAHNALSKVLGEVENMVSLYLISFHNYKQLKNDGCIVVLSKMYDHYQHKIIKQDAILNQIQQAITQLTIPQEKFVSQSPQEILNEVIAVLESQGEHFNKKPNHAGHKR